MALPIQMQFPPVDIASDHYDALVAEFTAKYYRSLQQSQLYPTFFDTDDSQELYSGTLAFWHYETPKITADSSVKLKERCKFVLHCVNELHKVINGFSKTLKREILEGRNRIIAITDVARELDATYEVQFGYNMDVGINKLFNDPPQIDKPVANLIFFYRAKYNTTGPANLVYITDILTTMNLRILKTFPNAMAREIYRQVDAHFETK